MHCVSAENPNDRRYIATDILFNHPLLIRLKSFFSIICHTNILLFQGNWVTLEYCNQWMLDQYILILMHRVSTVYHQNAQLIFPRN